MRLNLGCGDVKMGGWVNVDKFSDFAPDVVHDLAEGAALRAIEAAGLEAGDIDCILLSTLSPQHDFPGTSFFLHERLGVPQHFVAAQLEARPGKLSQHAPHQ